MDAPVQLFTLVPQKLRRALKLYCFESGVSTEDFVTRAVAERLKRMATQPPRRGGLDSPRHDS